MAALATMERHLWLNLLGIKERTGPSFLMPRYRLLVSSVVERFQKAKKQAAAFQKYIPHHHKSHGLPGRTPSLCLVQSVSPPTFVAISMAYEVCGLPSPLSLKAHSTRSMASSKTLLSGASLQDMCDVAGWSSPYSLDLPATPGSQALMY